MKIHTMILTVILFWFYVAFCIYIIGKVGGII